jgi:hypothetical protein
MKKEFVPYELALALKTLGFDEPCLAKHDLKHILLRVEECKSQESASELDYILAPLYQQAFRWFREKYGYWSYIKEATKGTCRFYIEKFDENFFNSDIIDSYEEAELECLKKLIEIVKTIR